jgi:transposase
MEKFRAYEIGIGEGMTIDIGQLLPPSHLVFFVEQKVSELDTSKIESKYSHLGKKGLHPKLLLSVLFLGYMQGIRSGRKLAIACKENIAYIYISKGYFPKKTVINEFRRLNVDHFDDLFRQVLGLIEDTDIKDASTSIFDGSKLGANASKYQSRDKATYERWLSHLSADIEAIEKELAIEKKKELEKDLAAKEKLQKKIKTAIATFRDSDKKVNLTDPDAPNMKGKKGNIGAFYNVQVGCNEHQTILYADVNTDGNDKQQLKPCIKGIQKNTDQKVKVAIADPGYASFDNYEYMEKWQIEGYVPDQDFGKDFEKKPYHKSHFIHDSENDILTCPQGKTLVFFRNKKDGTNQYKIYQGTSCEDCPVKDKCTTAKKRTVAIEIREPLRLKMRQRLDTEQGKAIYKKRLHPVEAIFGHLKFNLGYTYFLLRGLKKVNAEFKLMCLTYNLRKLVSFFNLFLAIYGSQRLKKLFIPIFQRTTPLYIKEVLNLNTHLNKHNMFI